MKRFATLLVCILVAGCGSGGGSSKKTVIIRPPPGVMEELAGKWDGALIAKYGTDFMGEPSTAVVHISSQPDTVTVHLSGGELADHDPVCTMVATGPDSATGEFDSPDHVHIYYFSLRRYSSGEIRVEIDNTGVTQWIVWDITPAAAG